MSTAQSFLLSAKRARQRRREILDELDAITESVEDWDARVEREEREKEVCTSGRGWNHYYHSTRKTASRRNRWDWTPPEWVLDDAKSSKRGKSK